MELIDSVAFWLLCGGCAILSVAVMLLARKIERLEATVHRIENNTTHVI